METKELLKDFSTDEFREEIKRRNKEARAAAGRKKTVWYEWTGVVARRYKEFMPVHQIGYYIESDNDEVYGRTFYLKPGLFNKKNMPKEGDTVKLSVKITKADKGRPPIRDSRIIEIVESK